MPNIILRIVVSLTILCVAPHLPPLAAGITVGGPVALSA